MRKIKDKHILGMISGLIGGISMISADHISTKLKISKRSYSEASAGMWLGTKRQVKSKAGTTLGLMMSLLTGISGSIIMTEILAKRGRDNINAKGLLYGSVYGGIITALQSALPENKIRPKDGSSNLSYLSCNALYGLVTANCIARLGDDSIFPRSPASSKAAIGQLDDYHLNPKLRPETQESYFQRTRH